MEGDDIRAKVQDTHTQLFEFVQRQFGDVMSALQTAELELVRHCQGLHEGIASHCNQQHQALAGRMDFDFVRALDTQGEELVRIVQNRFAEMARDLKQCHGGACAVLNRRAAVHILEQGRAATG